VSQEMLFSVRYVAIELVQIAAKICILYIRSALVSNLRLLLPSQSYTEAALLVSLAIGTH
jgi:hypothetical protein